ncbi:MAG: polyprenyl synthetase family protein, partial [Actinomycetota bacterium]|nr:polyprenyl synthetase family protein [Actinomycetota bacterium]
MNTGEQLAPVLAAGGPGLARGLRLAEARLGEVAGAHGEILARYAGGTLAAGGKRLRPLLVFLCAGRSEPGENVVAAAAAVELLHMATLVHDDVLDRAPLRRGYPTVFATAGRDAATATGDLLFSRAFAELAATGNAPAVQALSAASTALARGELMQRDDAWSPDVTAARYRERCGLKTGSLFAASCRLGAELGD